MVFTTRSHFALSTQLIAGRGHLEKTTLWSGRSNLVIGGDDIGDAPHLSALLSRTLCMRQSSYDTYVS